MKNLGHNSGNDETLPPKQDSQFCKILKRTHRSVKSLKMTPIILLLFQKVPLKHGKSPYHRDNKIPPEGATNYWLYGGVAARISDIIQTPE